VRHENTIVYSKCIELMQTARDAIKQFPKGFAFLAEQLRKNTASTTLNFAEGRPGVSSGATSAMPSSPPVKPQRPSTALTPSAFAAKTRSCAARRWPSTS